MNKKTGKPKIKKFGLLVAILLLCVLTLVGCGQNGSGLNIMILIYYPLGKLFWLCYQIVHDYGLAIILFAVIARLCLIPIGVKSEKSRRKMQKFQPKIQALQAKYKGDTRNPKYNEEIQKLYSEEGYSPTSGCLPALIQLPVILGLWNSIRNPLTYVFDVTGLEKIFARIQELGGLVGETYNINYSQLSLLNSINEYRAQLTDLLPSNYPEYIKMTFLGLNLGDTPKLAFEWGVLIPILSGVTSFLVGYLSQKINKRVDESNGVAVSGADPAKSMNFMLYTMPLISLVMAFSFQYGVGIYWIASNLLSLGQSYLIPHLVKDKEEEKPKKEKKLNYNQIEKIEREKALGIYTEPEENSVKKDDSESN